MSNPDPSQSHYLPNPDRLSILAATILLAYAFTRFVDLPPRQLSIELPGAFFTIEINIRTIMILIVSGLTASGSDWLLRDHPALGNRATFQHWLLPALTAWVIGVPLYRLPFGTLWVASFLIGSALLMLVMVAEYIVVDTSDVRYAMSAAGLTAVSFALYLALAIALRSAGTRLFLVLPILTFSCALVALRTLHLRLHGHWLILQAGTLAFISAQFITALHYLPISSIGYGLALLAPAYALTSLIGGLYEGNSIRQAIIEPIVVLFIVWGIAFWTG
jgi:hypothetical protein